MLNVSPGLPSRKYGDIGFSTGRNWNDLRAVRQKSRVVANDSHLLHDFLELGHHGLVVSYGTLHQLLFNVVCYKTH